DPCHIMPFLADMFASLPRNSNVAWYAVQTDTLGLFANIWQKMGFTGKILIDVSAIGRRSCDVSNVHFVSKALTLAEADVFVVDFGSKFSRTLKKIEQNVSDNRDPRLTFTGEDYLRSNVYNILRHERERENAGKLPRRIIALNAINNRFEGF